jgi:GNAT superfamily N-acetyltransferase
MQVTIRPLAETDLVDADRIFRLAFGTFLALPDPMSFSGDAQIMRSRWLADPSAGFGAYIGHELVGSSFAAKWGSFGVFGPVTVRPDLWDRGIARRLLEAAIARFADWQTKQLGLVTFSMERKARRPLSEVRFLASVLDTRDVETGPAGAARSGMDTLLGHAW